MPPPRGRVLAIAGSDSGGGAGIQADIKTIAALGGYAATAITAITAQNTLGVHAIHQVPPAMSSRARSPRCWTTSAPTRSRPGCSAMRRRSRRSATRSRAMPSLPLVLDPVMVAKGGVALLDPDALGVLKRRLLPLATLITPNLPEAEALTGIAVRDAGEMAHAAEALLALGAAAVLLKGGHLPGETVTDLLATQDGGPLRLDGPADRDPAHARHRLHAGERDRDRAGAGHGAGRCGATRARAMCARRSRRRRGSAAATGRSVTTRWRKRRYKAREAFGWTGWTSATRTAACSGSTRG